MSHTKQTPILNYSTADLPVGDPAGTVVFNTDENCLNYYNGTVWVTSDDWESTYTTVSSNSASWIGGDYDDSLLQATSGNWNSTYTTVSANSGDWVSNYNWTNSQSASWIGGGYDDSLLQAASGNWNSAYTTVSANSAAWDGAVYEVSEPAGIYNKQLALFNDTNEIFKSSKLKWNINTLDITGGLDADALAIGTSGATFNSDINMSNNGISTITTIGMVGAAAISNVSTFNGVDVTAFSTDVTNWNSTYTTVDANSGVWSAGGSSAVVYEPGLNGAGIDPNAAALVAKLPSGYTILDQQTAPNPRGLGSVDLQVVRQNADEVAGATKSSILGGAWNKITTWGGTFDPYTHYSSIVGGQGNEIYRGAYSIILNGDNNKIGGVEPGTPGSETPAQFGTYSIACGQSCEVLYPNCFMFNDENVTFQTLKQKTFNIHAKNGLRLVTGTSLTPDPINIGDVLTCYDTDGHSKWASLSADEWNSTYTTVSSNSASWIGGDYDDSLLQATSGNWNSTYTTVSANSASWIGGDYDDSLLQATSGNWDSTYTTVSAQSANWSEGASTGVVFAESTVKGGATTTAALIVKEPGTSGYPAYDASNPGGERGKYAVDLQMLRGTPASTALTQVAGSYASAILGGQFNLINSGFDGTSYGAAAVITGGSFNEINAGMRSAILGGTNNIIGEEFGLPGNDSIASGKYCFVKHNNTFTWNDGGGILGSDGSVIFETKKKQTFNIHAHEGLRLVTGSSITPDPINIGDVLTCYDTDGHSKWASLSADEWNSTYTAVSLSADEWNSTYTTVSSNSATWDTSTVYAVSALLTATAGARAFVSDSDATHAAGIGTEVVNTGSGVEFVPVYSNGSIWLIG